MGRAGTAFFVAPLSLNLNHVDNQRFWQEAVCVGHQNDFIVLWNRGVPHDFVYGELSNVVELTPRPINHNDVSATALTPPERIEPSPVEMGRRRHARRRQAGLLMLVLVDSVSRR